MQQNYILRDKKQIFFYNRLCKGMNNIEAIKKSDIAELVLNENEKNYFIEKIKDRVEFNKKYSWKKRISMN